MVLALVHSTGPRAPGVLPGVVPGPKGEWANGVVVAVVGVCVGVVVVVCVVGGVVVVGVCVVGVVVVVSVVVVDVDDQHKSQ